MTDVETWEIMKERDALRAEIERLREGRDTMGNLWAKEKADNERLRALLRRAINAIADWELTAGQARQLSDWLNRALDRHR